MIAKAPQGAQIDWGHSLARGMIGCWRMIEPGGTRVYDIARGNHGTAGSLITRVAGARGRAVKQTGTWANGHTQIDRPAEFPLTTPWSVGGWVRLDATSASGLFSWGDGATNKQAQLFYNGGWRASFVGGADTFSGSGGLTSTTVTTGTWHHVIATFDGTNIRIFLDAAAGHISGSASPTAPTGTVLAKIGGNYSAFAINGQIDSVAFWNRALTLEEIQALYVDSDAFLVRPRAAALSSGAAGPFSASVAVTLDGATAAGAGQVIVSGSAAVTLGGATVAAAATATVSGAAALSLEGATVSAAGTVLVQGSVNVTLDGASLTANANTGGAVNATVAVTLDDCGVASSAVILAGKAVRAARYQFTFTRDVRTFGFTFEPGAKDFA